MTNCLRSTNCVTFATVVLVFSSSYSSRILFISAPLEFFSGAAICQFKLRNVYFLNSAVDVVYEQC